MADEKKELDSTEKGEELEKQTEKDFGEPTK